MSEHKQSALEWFFAPRKSCAQLEAELAATKQKLAEAEELAAGLALSLQNEQEDNQHWVQRVEALEAERKELLSSLEAYRNSFDMHTAQIKAFEVERKELEKQEPVAYLNLAVWRTAGYAKIFATPDRFFDNQDALFTRPLPAPDLQNAFDELEKTYNMVLAENAEMTKKLAEQQARISNALRFIPEGSEAEKILIASGDAELTTFLSAAKAEGIEEGKRLAVPEGWQVVPKEPTNSMLEDVGTMRNYSDDTSTADADHIEWYKAMLAAAPNHKEE